MKSKCLITPQRMPYEAPDVFVTRISVESNFLASKFNVQTETYTLESEDDEWI